VGQRATFTVDAFPERRFVGEVAQVRLSATTTNNVVTYPVVIAVDNRDGVLLPGMTANAEIVVSQKENVLRVPNSALRYKPADDEAGGTAPQAAGARGGGMGMAEDLQALAASLSLTAAQRTAFESAMSQMRERMQARVAAAQGAQQGGSRLFGGAQGGPGGGQRRAGGGDAGAFRQRMVERMTQQFGAFRATLTPAQQQRWDAGLVELAAARRAPLYKLVDGVPKMVMVRVGASDGSTTEVSGPVAEGDVVVTGAERAKE
jgi:HlyD family secretion protein